MLLFSTIFGINNSMTKYNFVRSVIKWNQNSAYDENIIPGISWNKEDYNVRFGDDRVWLDIQEFRKKNIVAVRYEKTDSDGVVWDSDYVANFDEMKMTVRLERSYLETALKLNPGFSTPLFITMLIENGFIRKDGVLEVSDKPFFIDGSNIGILSDVINGKSGSGLSVVYVSKTGLNENPVDVFALAERLKGIAHVLVQESIVTNSEIGKSTDNRNETHGAIGIYFPNKAFGNKTCFYRKASGVDPLLADEVVRLVIQYGNTQMTEPIYTWQGVNNALLRERLEKKRAERLRAEEAWKAAEKKTLDILDSMSEKERDIRMQATAEAKSEADKLLEAFEDDEERLKKQIEELMAANEKLQIENQRLKNKIDSNNSVPLLFMGEENDFYPGEIKDLILTVLNDALEDLKPNSRRADIVKDIIANNKFEKITEKKAETIKRLLKDYDGMSPALRKALEDLGFVITEDGKHYKVTYFSDGRYHTIFSKTPSSKRAGKESASDVINTVF